MASFGRGSTRCRLAASGVGVLALLSGCSCLQIGGDRTIDADLDIIKESDSDGTGTTMTCNGFKLPTFDKRSVSLCASLMSHENKLHAVLNNLLDALPEGVGVIDGGGWLGDTAMRLAKHRHVGNVFTIENQEDRCKYMKSVCDDNEITKIKIIRNSLGKTVDTSTGNTTIDQLIASGALKQTSAWPHIGLIHLDLEGDELEAVLGATMTMQTRKPIIVTQVCVPYCAKKFQEMKHLFKKKEYRTFSIEEDSSDLQSTVRMTNPDSKCRNIVHVPIAAPEVEKALTRHSKGAAHVTALRYIPGLKEEHYVGP